MLFSGPQLWFWKISSTFSGTRPFKETAWKIKTHLRWNRSRSNSADFRRPLLTLAAVDRYVAVLALPVVRLGDVALGQRLKVVTHDGPREGTVVWKALEPSVAQTTGTPALYAVHVQFQSEGQVLRVGTSCRVLVP